MIFQFNKIIKKLHSKIFTLKFLSFCVIFFSIIPIYAILCIKLNFRFTPHIGYSTNSDALNDIFLNLSYSYIAASIFFILLTYLPHKIKSHNTKDFINNNINLLNKSLDIMILTLNGNDADAKIKINQSKLSELIDFNYSPDWDSPEMHRTQKYRHQFVSKCASDMLQCISEILEYRDYITENQYKSLLELKGDITLRVLSTEIFPEMCNKREDAKNAFKISFYNLVIKIRNLHTHNLYKSNLELE